MARDQTLADLVRDRSAELGISGREIARRSGDRLSYGTVGRILRREARGVNDDALEGLAIALDLPLTVVRRAAGRTLQTPPPEFVLPKRASNLTPRQRQVILSIVDALLGQEGEPPPRPGPRRRPPSGG